MRAVFGLREDAGVPEEFGEDDDLRRRQVDARVRRRDRQQRHARRRHRLERVHARLSQRAANAQFNIAFCLDVVYIRGWMCNL